jgi:hypothetical protein
VAAASRRLRTARARATDILPSTTGKRQNYSLYALRVTHSHSHALRSGPAPLGPVAARIVVGLLVVIGVAVVAGAVLLWPSDVEEIGGAAGGIGTQYDPWVTADHV